MGGVIPRVPPPKPMADNIQLESSSFIQYEEMVLKQQRGIDYVVPGRGKPPPPAAPVTLPRMTRGGGDEVPQLGLVLGGVGLLVCFAAIPVTALLGLWGILPILLGIFTILLANIVGPSEPKAPDTSPQELFARGDLNQLEMEQEIDRQLALGQSGFESMEIQADNWTEGQRTKQEIQVDGTAFRLKQEIAKRERDFTPYTVEEAYRKKLIEDVMEYDHMPADIAQDYVDERMATDKVVARQNYHEERDRQLKRQNLTVQTHHQFESLSAPSEPSTDILAIEPPEEPS